jgi:hypothetical protein
LEILFKKSHVSLMGGGNWSTRRKPPTLSHNVISSTPRHEQGLLLLDHSNQLFTDNYDYDHVTKNDLCDVLVK